MKGITLSTIALLALSGYAVAGGTIEPQPKEVVVEEVEESFGTVSGQFRSFYIDRTYSGVLENNRNSLAMGGHIGYDTKSFSGLSFGFKAYGTYGFELHGTPITSVNYDPSLYGDDFDNYAFIGQAYVNYTIGNTAIKIGRQRLDTPLAGADDARMLPNLFEAVVVSNTDIQNTTLIAAHVTKETVGTFGNVYGEAGALSLQSGYGLGYKLGTSGDFATMGEIALGEGTDTSGVSAVAAIYAADGLKLQAWDYYAYDILNAIYLQADYKFDWLTASAQYINQTDTGDALAGEVDSNYLGFKVAATYENLSAYVAFSTTSSSDDTTMNGGIITPWGGMPAFTQGMVTRHQFFADTEATKVAATYKFAETGLDIKATAYYVSFDVGVDNTYVEGTAWTATESGFDIQYNPEMVKGLNLRLRANFPTDFKPGLDWSEYRFIVNYSF